MLVAPAVFFDQSALSACHMHEAAFPNQHTLESINWPHLQLWQFSSESNVSCCSFGGGLMVTDGANFKAFNSIFSNNAVSVYGSIGGGIWLSACQAYVRPWPLILCFLKHLNFDRSICKYELHLPGCNRHPWQHLLDVCQRIRCDTP